MEKGVEVQVRWLQRKRARDRHGFTWSTELALPLQCPEYWCDGEGRTIN